ncbi:4Fe-4S binding protein [Intestinimonas butyriciproducens]|uniref:4Fe-4S binding protein n=1 Tax=Intestinimonas butyriciproducens TaxID=1297617 RepID=UPI00242FCFD6
MIVGCPTYAGKLPNKILPDFQSRLRGNGALAVAVVTYGNRSFDNALAELCAVLEQGGFHPVAGGAFVCRHAMTDRLAGDRPNADDLSEMATFAQAAAERIGLLRDTPAPLTVPGNASAPYYVPKGADGQPVKFLKAKPKTHMDKCTNCGRCALVCPMGSIDPEQVDQVPGVCIKCHACIRICPLDAKYFDDPALLSHKQMLENTFLTPQENRIFL